MFVRAAQCIGGEADEELIYCVCGRREIVLAEAYKKKEELNRSSSVRREVAAEMARGYQKRRFNPIKQSGCCVGCSRIC